MTTLFNRTLVVGDVVLISSDYKPHFGVVSRVREHSCTIRVITEWHHTAKATIPRDGSGKLQHYAKTIFVGSRLLVIDPSALTVIPDVDYVNAIRELQHEILTSYVS